MPGASAQVNSAFSTANEYASSATTSLTGFTNAMNAAIYSPPTIALTWSTPPVPTIPAIGSAPTLPSVEFNAPSSQPIALTEAVPTITVPTFSDTAPSLSFPVAPVLSFGSAPIIPAVSAVAVPAAPTLTLPGTPTFLTLSSVTFGGIDIHADWLTKLEDIPTLTLVSPTPYSYARGAEYASNLLGGLKATLLQRLAGGTGLPTAVEQAIWDRARSRETQIALANESEVMRNSEAMGYQLPAGVLAAQLRDAQKDYYDKLSTLSRDVSIKQAELEQENMNQTIAQGMELEGKLIDYSYKLEQLTFETAKAYADNAIQVHNAAVEQYKALLSGYQAYEAAYKTLIEAELAKVEVYKAELAGEQTKAQINNNLVLQYKTQIEAGMTQVEIFKAQVGAANTLVQLEQTKISAAGEQIRAYTAQINAETSKVEAYKAQVQGEATKVEVYKTQAQVFGTLAGTQAEVARTNIARYQALAQSKSMEWDGYRALIAGETARVQALGIQSSSLLDGYKASAQAAEAQGNISARMWESSIRQYEGGMNLTLQTAKINGDFAIATNNSRMDAAKAGAQVYAQLASSAYSMIHASASISGGDSTSVSYSYSGDAPSFPPSMG